VAEHLTPEQLEQYRRGTATPSEMLALDDHLSQCEACRMALEKLVTPMSLTRWAEGLARYEDERKEEAQPVPAEPAVVAKPQVPSSVPSRWRPRWWWIPALAAVLVVGVLLWKRPVPAEVAKIEAPSFLEVLNDAGGVVQLDSTGIVRAPAGAEQGQEILLADVLKAKSLPLAGLPSDLAAPPGTLLGPSRPDEFAPLAPLSIVVYSDRPEFRWQPLQGALTYEVQVFDSEFREVDSSGKIRATEWTPVRGLARGALYQWQVTAYRSGDSVRVPTPPAADARFRVLNAETFGKVEAARAAPPAHLLAAILLAKAGMKEEARKEMDAVAAANPDSALVREMMSNLER
jgi:hypothetical protein